MRRLVFSIPVVAAIAAVSPAARAQVSLTEVNAATAMSQDMQGRSASAVTGAAEGAAESAPASAESVGLGGAKYIPAYAIVLMLVGLSTFVACRPSRRHSAD